MKNFKYTLVFNALFLSVLISACSASAVESTQSPTAIPTQPPAPNSIYDLFYEAKNEEGMTAIEEFLKSEPENAEGIALRGGFNARLGRADAALADANRAIELNPNLGLAYAVRGFIYSGDEEKIVDAKADLDKSLQLDPNLPLAYSVRGTIYIDESEFEKAKADLERAVEIRPDYVAPNVYLGDALLGLEQYEDAVRQYDRALEIADQRGYIYYQRGIANLTLGNYEDTVSDMSASIEADQGQFAGPHAVRAIAYENLGDSEKAFADYERALELGAEDSSIYNNLAYMIARREDGNYQKALEYVNKALEIGPSDDPTFLDTQAFVYYRLGEYEKAIVLFTTVIEAGEPFGYYGRGLAYQAMGDKEKAISDFESFLELYPDDVESEDAKKRLEALQSAP